MKEESMHPGRFAPSRRAGAIPPSGGRAEGSSLHPAKLSRQEDLRLITGRGRFTADVDLPGQLHAAVVRSDRAHARILSLGLEAAQGAEGVVAILTAQDVDAAGFKPIPAGGALKGADGEPLKTAPMPVLAGDRVRFVGQPIAMVIADTALRARDAAEQVVVEYDELPVAATVQAALQPGAAQLHNGAPGNLALTFEDGDAIAVDRAFARAAKTSTLRIVSQRLIGSPLELRACLAVHDQERDVTVIHTPTQGMLGMRSSLHAVTGWSAASIEVAAQDVGGSFGIRGGTFPEQVLTMLAARRLGRPVKWVSSRSELFIGEWHGRALTLKGSVALDEADKILALRFEHEADLGAYSCYWGSLIGTRNLAVTMGGVYRVPALHMRSRLVYTNTVPVSAYRGAGRPDIAFIIERLIDHAAAEHGLDRVALRLRNFVPNDAFPYLTANGTEYDCGDFAGVMRQALARADYEGFAARRAAAEARGRLRGIGFACYLEASGGGAAASDQVACRFAADGSLTLYAMTGPSGQGHETSFGQIVADGLGIPAERIGYRASDPASALIGNGTGGSRSLLGAGSAFKKLVPAIIERARPHAAAALGVPATALSYSDGRFSTADGKSAGMEAGVGAGGIGLEDLARRLADPGATNHPLDCTAESVAGVTFPNGCHVAEIEIDPRTGVTSIESYVAVDDLGHIVSPQLVEGQVHGGVVQGAGQAFGEQAVYDADSGQLLSGSFSDYTMPRAGLLKSIVSESHPVPTALNALGAKGVGESGCSGSLPALGNAMADALRGLGGPIDMPYTPPRVWEVIKSARQT
jgi:carbon-monoxide dehydrogenase large subunit